MFLYVGSMVVCESLLLKLEYIRRPEMHGPAFYGLPRNSGTVTLSKQAWTLPHSVPFGEAQLKPLRGGETLAWRLS